MKFSRPGLDKDRKSTRLNSSHLVMSYAVFCLKKKNNTDPRGHHHAAADHAHPDRVEERWEKVGEARRLHPVAKVCGIAAFDQQDVFFFNDTATTEIYTLSLHDALPI